MKESTRKRLDTRRLLGPRMKKIPFDRPPSVTLQPRQNTRRTPPGRGPVT